MHFTLLFQLIHVHIKT